MPVSTIAAWAGTDMMLKMLNAITTGIAIVFLFLIKKCMVIILPLIFDG